MSKDHNNDVSVTIISHNDLDGLCSVLMVKEYIKTYTKQEPTVWICQSPNALETYRVRFAQHIYVTDLCLNYYQQAELQKKCKKFIYIDHHGDDEHKPCATLQIIQMFKLEKYNRIGYLVDIYDRWIEDSPDWKEALDLNAHYWCLALLGDNDNISFRHKPMETDDTPGKQHSYRYIMERLLTVDRKNINRYYEISNKAINKATDEHIEGVDIYGNTYWLVPKCGDISYVSNSLLKTYPNISYVISVNNIDALAFGERISVRSKCSSTFNVTTLPGINGHIHAGGGVMSKELKDMLNM